MSDHAGIRGRLEAAGRNELLTGFNRVSGIVASAVLVPMIGVLGLQVWNDIKEGQQLNNHGLLSLTEKVEHASDELQDKIDAVAADVSTVKINQAVTESEIRALELRVDKVETHGAGSKSKGRMP